MGKVEVDARGRITIAKIDREKLKIVTGQQLYTFIQNDTLVIKKSLPIDEFKKALEGCIKFNVKEVEHR